MWEMAAAVFGASFVQKLAAMNVFLVGSGALGCEFLKNLALMGVATAGGAKLSVTDDAPATNVPRPGASRTSRSLLSGFSRSWIRSL